MQSSIDHHPVSPRPRRFQAFLVVLIGVLLAGVCGVVAAGASASSPAAASAKSTPRCTRAELRLQLVDSQRATSPRYIDFAFKNIGKTKCGLRGYPRAALLNASNRAEHGRPAKVSDDPISPVRTVVIKPGKRAFFTFTWVDAGVCPGNSLNFSALRALPTSGGRGDVRHLGTTSACDYSGMVSPVRSALPQMFSRAPLNGGVREVQGIRYGTDPSQVMDAFLPAHATQATPAVVFVHGGAFIGGDKSSLFPEAKGVTSLGWAGITINYRVNGYPNESNDVIAATRWVHDHASQLNVNPSQLALLGTSSGGSLVAEAATVAHQQSMGLGIRAVVSWSGPMNLPLFGQTATQGAYNALNAYVGCPLSSCPAQWSAASPYSHVASGDPPMYLFNSTCEGIPYSQATSMLGRLRSAGDIGLLYTLTGKLHALQYASVAYAPSVEWLSQFLGPVYGAPPPVPNNNDGVPPAPAAC